MRVTIKDIVKYTGFSTTTISLILNGKGERFPDKTKDLIYKAVNDLGYRPNQVAVGLVKKETKTIGLVISDIRNVFFSTLAKGVEDKCRENGWNLILCNTNDLHQRDMEYIRVLADKGVDGILYAMAADSSFEKATESLDLMDSLKIPYIMIDRTIKDKHCNIVKTDHVKGGYLATKHLIELGHKRIACVTGPIFLNDTISRLLGYKKALTEANIPYDPTLIYEGKYTIESGRDAVDTLLEKDYSAVFAFNDMSAYGVYNQLKKYNRHIPEDVSLVGYDNIFFSELLDVPLTSINQPVYKAGAKAAELIINRKKSGEDQIEEIVFEPELVVRKSTRTREKKIRILNYGSLNIDYLYHVEHLNRVGDTQLSDCLEMFCSGKGFNQSVALRRSGTDVYHAGAVGKTDSITLTEMLEEAGINIDYLTKLNTDSGHTIIQKDSTGGNSILRYGGANLKIEKEDVIEVLSHFEKGDFLILQNEISCMKEIMERAHEKGMIIVLNPSPMHPDILKYPIEYVDYMILNESEAVDICGKNDEPEILIDKIVNRFPNTKVVLGIGEKGALFKSKESSFSQNGFKVEAVDMACADDTFAGYFISSIVKGKSIEESLKLAVKASAIALSRPGSALSIPTLKEVSDWKL